MVLLNTQNEAVYSNLELKYLLNVTRSGCVFCSAKDRRTGKTHLFLVFHQRDRIYVRNGLRGTWDEVKNRPDYDRIRQLFEDALANNQVPTYSTNRLNLI